MNALQVFSFNGMDSVRCIDRNGEPWFVAGDIAKALNYSNPNEAVRDHCKYVKKVSGIDLYGADTLEGCLRLGIRHNDAVRKYLVINERDLYIFISRSNNISTSRKELIITGFQEHGFLIDHHVKSRDEIDFIEMLSKILIPFDLKIETQFVVGSYYVDGWINGCSLAIEYDENNHSCYDKEIEKQRECYIIKELSCDFIRVSDDKSHSENCGIVIKYIMDKIYGKMD